MIHDETLIIDSGGANVSSLLFAFERLGVPARLSNDPADLAAASRAILPGVGAAGHAMARLSASGMDVAVRAFRGPLLGICLGMQLLFECSDEGDTPTLGVVPGKVSALTPSPRLLSPHMGWNTVETNSDSILFKGVESESFYFVHSYAAKVAVGKTQAWSTHGEKFLAAVEDGYISATQFHPEKSGAAGLALIKNWVGSL